VAADEVVSYPVKENVLFQDNWSAMLLEEKGRQSAGKRSRHLNIRLFFVKDQKEKGILTIQYCPTDEMIGDFMTKPLHGKKFEKFWQSIMNLCCEWSLSEDKGVSQLSVTGSTGKFGGRSHQFSCELLHPVTFLFSAVESK
jgi:hypothetical protein